MSSSLICPALNTNPFWAILFEFVGKFAATDDECCVLICEFRGTMLSIGCCGCCMRLGLMALRFDGGILMLTSSKSTGFVLWSGDFRLIGFSWGRSVNPWKWLFWAGVIDKLGVRFKYWFMFEVRLLGSKQFRLSTTSGCKMKHSPLFWMEMRVNWSSSRCKSGRFTLGENIDNFDLVSEFRE